MKLVIQLGASLYHFTVSTSVYLGICPVFSQVKFLVEAAQLLGDVRRVLMWTYAYAFFLPSEHPNRRYGTKEEIDLSVCT
jgi:hypothetical protein